MPSRLFASGGRDVRHEEKTLDRPAPAGPDRNGLPRDEIRAEHTC
jgi:hypothetical protein